MKQIIGVIFLVFVIVIGMSIVEANDPNRNSETLSYVDESLSDEEEIETIKINITGEVENPGEYETTLGFFLQDIINQAGGITSKADETCFDYWLILDKDLNIYIPPVSDEIKVDINEADLETLTSLNGIGNTLGSRIIDYRQDNGYFTYLEQIMNVEGIGKSIFFKIKDHICL